MTSDSRAVNQDFDVRIVLYPKYCNELISERIDEIKSSAGYFKFFDTDTHYIDLCRFKLKDKGELKSLQTLIRIFFKDLPFLSFYTDGLTVTKASNPASVNSFSNILCYNLKPCARRFGYGSGDVDDNEDNTDDTKTILNEFYECIQKSGLANDFVRLSGNISIAESERLKDAKYLMRAIKSGRDRESLSLADRLKQFLSFGARKPQHIPRRLCFVIEATELRIIVNERIYKKYSFIDSNFVENTDYNFEQNQSKNYRRSMGYEVDPIPASARMRTNAGRIELSEGEPIYLISDLHLNHLRIIKHSGRPFLTNDVISMNEVLINNWNNTINPKDRVLYLGDLTYNAKVTEADNLLKKLNGDITFIAGNHETISGELLKDYELNYKGYEFYFIHNPKFAPKNYRGWLIHGHTHNSRMCKYPFINHKLRTVNVSCEVIGYRPITLDEIIAIIEKSRKSGIMKVYSRDYQTAIFSD